jgi:hypothetical protein
MKAVREVEIVRATSLLEQAELFQAETLSILATAKASGDLPTALAAIREGRANAVLLEHCYGKERQENSPEEVEKRLQEENQMLCRQLLKRQDMRKELHDQIVKRNVTLKAQHVALDFIEAVPTPSPTRRPSMLGDRTHTRANAALLEHCAEKDEPNERLEGQNALASLLHHEDKRRTQLRSATRKLIRQLRDGDDPDDAPRLPDGEGPRDIPDHAGERRALALSRALPDEPREQGEDDDGVPPAPPAPEGGTTADGAPAPGPVPASLSLMERIDRMTEGNKAFATRVPIGGSPEAE